MSESECQNGGTSAGPEALPRAAEDILPLVYKELHRLAQQRLRGLRPGQTLQPTALVNEVYLRLIGNQDPGWNGRGHFFGAAALAMRNILVERAMHKATLKQGGNRRRVELEEQMAIVDDTADDSELIEIHQSLERLKAVDPRKEEIVMMRFFAGLTIAQTAQVMGIAESTVERDWAFAKAWLFRELQRTGRGAKDA